MKVTAGSNRPIVPPPRSARATPLKRRGTVVLFRRGWLICSKANRSFPMAKSKMKIGRSAISGQVVPVKVAISRPNTTVIETIKKDK